jgi:hypothetical protein
VPARSCTSRALAGKHISRTVQFTLYSSLHGCTAELPVYITLSHKLSGRLGLLEREAAAALNASLAPLAAAVIPQYAAAMRQLGLHVPLYITGV